MAARTYAQYKRVLDEVTPQLEVLQKAIELDPDNAGEYKKAIAFCETNIAVTSAIIQAIKLVNKEDNKRKQKEAEEKKKAPEVKTEENIENEALSLFGE
ncbi:hypothetical protein HMPREF0872_00425 [Veillonella montpellierensis DNF00314]|uniref:Uncharacterized protein n=1 Tax=Veillonella montpellierensis DNF00314 TaxID=1401067 RepID=A0A096ALY0_9FIRM|nr:hypothetical protein [Veillonella montpellierensis]KGF48103.1 hypothetical protein HMPREF0872_00425 [Veillonella montpellierensis DNF00314]